VATFRGKLSLAGCPVVSPLIHNPWILTGCR